VVDVLFCLFDFEYSAARFIITFLGERILFYRVVDEVDEATCVGPWWNAAHFFTAAGDALLVVKFCLLLRIIHI